MRASQSGLPFSDLQLRVAELVGYNAYRTTDDDNRAIPPTDPNRLDRVKRAINHAAREFYRAVNPEANNIHQWTWLRETVYIALDPEGDSAINIDGDSRRYRLPEHVSSQCVRADWSSPSYPGRMVYVVHGDQTRRHWTMYPDATGAPLYLSVVASPGDRKAGERTPYEMIVAPAPTDASEYTVAAEFSVRTDPLVQDADYGPWAPEDDLTIVWWAASLLSIGDSGSFERFEAKRIEALRASIAMDNTRKASNLTKRKDAQLPQADVRVEFEGTRIL